jgi:hypothetical protein
MRITKREFYQGGGFANPRYYRKMVGDKWTYWEVV